LGFPHPDYLLKALTSRQLAEWRAFYRLQPFGAYRDDWRAGMIASVIANCNRRKNTKPFLPTDFMPQTEKPKQSVEEQLAIFEMLTGTLQ
jgi:hypothetical protein